MCTGSPRIVETALFADEQSDSMLRKKLGKSDSPWDSVILTDRRSPHRNDSLEDRLFPQGCPACLPKTPHFHWPARALLLKVLAAWEGALPRASALARVSRARARRRPTLPRGAREITQLLIIWRSPFEYTMYRDVEVQPCCGFAAGVFGPLAQGADVVESLERAPCGGARARRPARARALSQRRGLNRRRASRVASRFGRLAVR